MQEEHNLTDEMIAGRRPDSHDHLPEDMPRWMSHTIVAIDTLSLWVGRAVSWLTLPLILAMTYEVVARYFFTAPTVWAYDISRMVYGAMFVLGAAYALSKGVHIRSDFLYRKWSVQTQGRDRHCAVCVLLLPGDDHLHVGRFAVGLDFGRARRARHRYRVHAAARAGQECVADRHRVPYRAGYFRAAEESACCTERAVADMSPEIIGFIMIAAMLAGIFVGFPISFTLIFLGLAFGYWGFGELVFYLMTLQFNATMMEQTLAAVPLFVFMGIMMEQANLMERLFDAVQKMLSRVRGSLYLAVMFVATIFAAATGIVGASVTILGIMAGKSMIRSGYDVQLSSGLIAAGGTLGILIPPSIMLVVMGPVLEVPVTTLFAAAIVPGLLLALMFTGYAMIRCLINPALGPALPKELQPTSMREVWLQFLQGLVPPAALVLAALGSIVFGLATPTEGAACGALGALLLTAAYRRLTWRNLKDALIKTLEITVLILFLVAASNFFGAVFARLGTPTMITEVAARVRSESVRDALHHHGTHFPVGMAARMGADRADRRPVPVAAGARRWIRCCLVRDPRRSEPADRLAVAAGGDVGLFPEGRRAAVGAGRHLQGHAAVHGAAACRPGADHRVSADRALAAGSPVRKVTTWRSSI